MTTLYPIKLIIRSLCRRGVLFIPVAVVCGALSPQAKAVCREGCDLTNSNTFLGDAALLNNTEGYTNTAVGSKALYSNTTGIGNTANGDDALHNNTSGAYNTATGAGALYGNITGGTNTADGYQALVFNTTGSGNVAVGDLVLYRNTTGQFNTATGSGALLSNTTGDFNTASGASALLNNTTGGNNTTTGAGALFSNTTGFQNTAIGANALSSNTTGHRNAADGFQALYNNTGSNNVGLGFNAGSNLTTGSGNVCIGSGVTGVAGESNTTRIRNVYSSVASARAVYVNSENKIGTLVSSRRFKDEIKPMEEVSQAILKLKPVTFHYKKEIEPNDTIMFGLIAEDVEQVDRDLVTRNDKGEPETVRYDAVNAMLLNEFLKEHKKVQEEQAMIERLASKAAEQETTTSELRRDVGLLAAQIKEQAAEMRKVSIQLEMSNPSKRIVTNR